MNVSVVVPVLNESKTIKKLLESLKSQTKPPDEILIIDSGSTDGTIEIVKEWIKLNKEKHYKYRIIGNIGGMPGANRNLGIKNATYEWIALIDAGITLNSNWLEKITNELVEQGTKAVMARCNFIGTNKYSLATCAVSYGLTDRNVLPGSIFHKAIINKIPIFNEKLRAGEDRIWLENLFAAYKGTYKAKDATIEYSIFPESSLEILKKYYKYELSAQKIPNHIFKRLPLIIIYFIFGALITAGSIKLFFYSLIGYITLRGIIDPMRKSKKILWFSRHPDSFYLAIRNVLIIDTSILCAALIRFVKCNFWRKIIKKIGI